MSLSLLIAGPYIDMLSEKEKKAKLDQLEQMKSGFENENESGLIQWARAGWPLLWKLFVAIFSICCLIYGSLWVASIDEGFLHAMLVCLFIFLAMLLGSGIFLILC